MLNDSMEKANGHLAGEWCDDFVTYELLYIVVTYIYN